jgi:MFS transporter, SP family, solute carrier family 2 (myo-inositol transporter), member 13
MISVYFLTAVASIGGFLFGYDTGVISGALVLIDEEFDLNEFQSELVVSVTVLGALFSSILAGPLSDHYGRRPVVLLSSAVFALGAALMASAASVEMLYAGRLVVGLGVGAASMCMPVYISEVGKIDF